MGLQSFQLIGIPINFVGRFCKFVSKVSGKASEASYLPLRFRISKKIVKFVYILKIYACRIAFVLTIFFFYIF